MNKEENFFKKLKKKREKGITLIALVITIIVLLILAGVTINAITGNESAMEKAQQARTENEHADELDSIKLAVVDAVAKGIDGKVHGKELKSALEGLVEDTSTITDESTGPWTIIGKAGVYNINGTGTVEDADIELPEGLKVGDVVDYNPTNTSVTISINESGAESAQTFNLDEGMTWKVLSINRDTGVVELVGEPTSTNLTLKGKKGFINGETVLNKIGAIYGHGKGAQSGRSITVDDIYAAMGYDKPSTYNSWYNKIVWRNADLKQIKHIQKEYFLNKKRMQME